MRTICMPHCRLRGPSWPELTPTPQKTSQQICRINSNNRLSQECKGTRSCTASRYTWFFHGTRPYNYTTLATATPSPSNPYGSYLRPSWSAAGMPSCPGRRAVGIVR
ncbi:hypothetical protein K505DRAFT_123833 [Melanomma pulvis-pyrius CBS 109.77]|uniref:Uncharacterized protein n=1 Tax=Melanomma pulvis-pyrius CBS 109.77 TaxID=1314802 RepID=A0A6A6WU42_9PLEO|nr:hypothetical protein K505DRAFT_123833 [Melanomma pulvis-pyrius CBS 109.77]